MPFTMEEAVSPDNGDDNKEMGSNRSVFTDLELAVDLQQQKS